MGTIHGVNISRINPGLKKALKKENIKVKGLTGRHQVKARAFAINIFYEEKVLRKIINKFNSASPKSDKVKASANLMISERFYAGRPITVWYQNPNSSLSCQKIKLPTAEPIMLFHFTNAKTPPNKANFYMYIVFDPKKPKEENIKSILSSQKICFSPKEIKYRASWK